MSSELYVLARRLDKIAEQHRSSSDFTAETLRAALRDTIACFPVYRSYIRPFINVIHDEDRHYILKAIGTAKKLNPALDPSVFDFIQGVLLMDYPSGLQESQKSERCEFIMRFQQLTGPIMAKGLEDTAFYRYYPLSSLNEVGNSNYNFGITSEDFHQKNAERFAIWPHSLLASSTHDTKRSEDVRARINTLSEMPGEWEQMLSTWSQINRTHKTPEGEELIPYANEEYLLYQTLIGSWPIDPMTPVLQLQYMHRIQAYMEKAIKEAKIYTSWVNPNVHYDQSMREFVQKVLNPDLNENPFLDSFKPFLSKVTAAGMLNSLSQTLLKLTSPGIPDIYQGNEIWDFSLVDPDNRRPVDFVYRKYLLQTMRENIDKPNGEALKKYLLNPEDGKIKLYITLLTLQLRQKYAAIFSHGLYIPLEVQGDKQKHIIAFMRTLEKKTIVVVVARFFTGLMDGSKLLIEESVWKNTRLVFPSNMSGHQFEHIFDGEHLTIEESDGKYILPLDKLLRALPLALLQNTEG